MIRHGIAGQRVGQNLPLAGGHIPAEGDAVTVEGRDRRKGDGVVHIRHAVEAEGNPLRDMLNRQRSRPIRLQVEGGVSPGTGQEHQGQQSRAQPCGEPPEHPAAEGMLAHSTSPLSWQ